MMDFITSEVKIVSKHDLGVVFREAIPSPLSKSKVVLIDDVIRAKKMNKNLLCPETQFPLKPDVLLHFGGMLESIPESGYSLSFFSLSLSSFYLHFCSTLFSIFFSVFLFM